MPLAPLLEAKRTSPGSTGCHRNLHRNLADGAANFELDGIHMDLKGQSGDVAVTITAYEMLRGDPIDSAVLTVAATDALLDPRAAGKYLALDFASNAAGGTFRLGKPTAYIKDGGSRR
jgi:hypothetical protein